MVKNKSKKNMSNIKSKKNARNVKEVKMRSETEETIKKFVILIIIMVIIVVGGYFLSRIIVDKRDSVEQESTNAGEVDYDIASIGTLLNRPYEEYYVMIYNSEDSDAIYYSSLITNYQAKKNSLKIYYCDLSNALNAKYVANDGNTNPTAKNTEDLRFGEVTLIKVKDGKISKAYETAEKIKENLQ